MKKIIFTTLLFCFFLSCQPTSSSDQAVTTSTPNPTEEKSPKEKIESYVKTLQMVKSATSKEYSFSEEGIQYDVEAVYVDEVLVTIIATYTKDGHQIEESFYIRNDDLVRYDENKIRKAANEQELAKVSATKIYLDQHHIIEVLEKSKESKPGGNLSLMDEYFTPVEVNQDSLMTVLNKQLNFFKEKH